MEEEQGREEVKEDLGMGMGMGGDSENVESPKIIDLSLLDIKKDQILGSGATSSVYKATYENVPVAAKIFTKSSDARLASILRMIFEREVSTLSKMKHENVVKLVGVSKDPDLMIVTELARGTLERYLAWAQNKNPDLKLVMCFALDISRAMQHVHEKGFFHRDLMPRNLLVSLEEDKTHHIKLADFGMAARIRKEEPPEEMTCDAGTLPYMAPEMYKIGESRKRYYDHKVDVFSFSILLWQLLTNKIPFDSILKQLRRNNIQLGGVPHRKAIEQAVANENERPSVADAELGHLPRPNDIASLLQSCWAKDPNQRPEFAEITGRLTSFFMEHFLTPPTTTALVPDQPHNEHEKENEIAAAAPSSSDDQNSPEVAASIDELASHVNEIVIEESIDAGHVTNKSDHI